MTEMEVRQLLTRLRISPIGTIDNLKIRCNECLAVFDWDFKKKYFHLCPNGCNAHVVKK